MVFLRKIYSDPSGLFDPVIFHDGINIIYGKKSKNAKDNDSINSVGKTTLVNLINFCLLAPYYKDGELYKAKKITDRYLIVLEIEIDHKIYFIARSTKSPTKVFFGEVGTSVFPRDIKDVEHDLTNLFFYNDDYEGVLNGTWFRKLLPLFLRNEKIGFLKDPTQYINQRYSNAEMTVYNLLLLGVDNKNAFENFEVVKQIKRKKFALQEASQILRDTYNVDILEASMLIEGIQKEIDKIENSISDFNLAESYTEALKDADEITMRIKDLVRESFVDQTKLNTYVAALKSDIGKLDLNKVTRLYSLINEDLGISVKRSLEEAINFRRELNNSRTRFLETEVIRLSLSVQNKNEELAILDGRRSSIYRFLEQNGAIRDLTEANVLLQEKREVKNELVSRVIFYNDIKVAIDILQEKESKLAYEAKRFVKEISEKVNSIRRLFFHTYEKLFGQTAIGVFDIEFKGEKYESKIEIVARSSDNAGWGKTRSRILLYDLTVLFNSIWRMRRFPCFLIHDGIFHGVDRSQFISAMNFLEFGTGDMRFQYIFTANEDDIWIKEDRGDQYGTLQVDLSKKIIAEYSDVDKIFRTNF